MINGFGYSRTLRQELSSHQIQPLMRLSFIKTITAIFTAIEKLPIGIILLFTCAYSLHFVSGNPYWLANFFGALLCFAILSFMSWLVQIGTAHDENTQIVFQIIFFVLITAIILWSIVPEPTLIRTSIYAEGILYVLLRHYLYPFQSTKEWRQFAHLNQHNT